MIGTPSAPWTERKEGESGHGPPKTLLRPVNRLHLSTIDRPYRPKPDPKIHLGDVAAPELATWRAQSGPAQAQPNPVTTRSTLIVDQSTLTVDLDPHVSDSLCSSQSELDMCHYLVFPLLFLF
jgi:hypothetical protein